MYARLHALLRVFMLIALAASTLLFAAHAAAEGDPASAPYVYLIDPNGPGMIWYGDSWCYVTADVSDPDGVGYVEYRLSTDDGATFPIVLGGGEGVTSIECITPNVDTTTARVMVTASDALGNTASYVSEYPFEIDAPSLSVSALSIGPAQLTGGANALGTVELAWAAPAGGATVELSSSNPAVASVPATVTVPEGESVATFAVPTSEVAATTGVTLGASFGGVTQVARLTVAPGTAVAPGLASVTFRPVFVTAGRVSLGTVALAEPAAVGGTAVLLNSSHPDIARVAAGVVVPGGQTSATFEIATVYGSAPTTVTIGAALGGATMSAPLTVTSSNASGSVAIARADYSTGNGKLRIFARSSDPTATLAAYVSSTGEVIGRLKYDAETGNHLGQFKWPTYPVQVTVVSSTGAIATARVRAR
jgi:hypothetical protein